MKGYAGSVVVQGFAANLFHLMISKVDYTYYKKYFGRLAMKSGVILPGLFGIIYIYILYVCILYIHSMLKYVY
jgi:hypothetical protein